MSVIVAMNATNPPASAVSFASLQNVIVAIVAVIIPAHVAILAVMLNASVAHHVWNILVNVARIVV